MQYSKSRYLKIGVVLFLCLSSYYAFYSISPVSAYTGTITYNVGTDTITAIGGTSGTPITFEDLYLADVAGGWGQSIKQGNLQYSFYCKIIFGDGSTQTYFTDSYKQVLFIQPLSANGQIVISVQNKTVFTLGKLTAIDFKNGYGGCQLIVNQTTYYGSLIQPAVNDNNCLIYLYGSSFSTLQQNYDMWVQAKRAYDCTFTWETYLHYTVYTAGDINNINSLGTIAIVRRPKADIIMNNLFGANPSAVGTGVWFQTTGGTVNGLKFIYTNTTYSSGVIVDSVISGDCYLINADLIERTGLDWQLHWSGTSTRYLYRQYSYDLSVLNGDISDFVENANVTLSKNNVKIGSWLANSSGQIPTQTLTYGFYNQTGGNTPYDTGYFTLTITHPDWVDYTSRFYITEKTKMTISMQQVQAQATPNPELYTENDEVNTYLVVGLMIIVVIIVALILWRRN